MSNKTSDLQIGFSLLPHRSVYTCARNRYCWSSSVPIFQLLVIAIIFFLVSLRGEAAVSDTPFPQPLAKKIILPEDLRGNAAKLAIDQDGVVFILTSKGIARLIGDRVAIDQSYRPLTGKIASDISITDGALYYLFPDEVLSNRRAGKFVHRLQEPYEAFGVNRNEEMLLKKGSSLSIFKEEKLSAIPLAIGNQFRINAIGSDFYVISTNTIWKKDGLALKEFATGYAFTTMTPLGQGLAVGTPNGFLILDPVSGKEVLPLQTRLPSLNITSLAEQGEYLWAGTRQGIWRRAPNGSFRYFASKRWLDDDDVLDLQVDGNGEVYALTRNALNKIEFQSMSLADKAAHYDRKIRQRHIRYGFCAELHLKNPEDITSAEMIDTDNDGTWSNYYMASQAFRYGATGDESARRNAWETFEALERLESINPIGGFPSRTFERVGFKVSDPERWYARGDGIWDWKAHTSSDEITAHAFGSAVLYECVAKTEGEKSRIATFMSKVLDHIIRNNWYLVDMDGKPTLWGRWNPEYVNAFPKTVVDRRLNSAEIIAMLQFGYKITGNERYKNSAYELMEKHGYLENILSPMSAIGFTQGVIHQGIDMGNEWNHSDDLLAFVSYWVLHRFAFNEELKSKYAAAIKDHWEMEKIERCPLWNFVYASTGASDYGLNEALWTFRHFPLDMTDWSISNSHRQDITRKEKNFRNQQLEELLPPDERRITRWNGQPFILDGGNGGRTELAGDEYLLPYWMGRYLKLIQ